MQWPAWHISSSIFPSNLSSPRNIATRPSKHLNKMVRYSSILSLDNASTAKLLGVGVVKWGSVASWCIESVLIRQEQISQCHFCHEWCTLSLLYLLHANSPVQVSYTGGRFRSHRSQITMLASWNHLSFLSGQEKVGDWICQHVFIPWCHILPDKTNLTVWYSGKCKNGIHHYIKSPE